MTIPSPQVNGQTENRPDNVLSTPDQVVMQNGHTFQADQSLQLPPKVPEKMITPEPTNKPFTLTENPKTDESNKVNSYAQENPILQQTKEQLRLLLINSAKDLVNIVKDNAEIQPFLFVKPFSIKNVQIIIFNHDEIGGRLFDPFISGAQIDEGILIYRTFNKNNSFTLKEQVEETYEEALNKISTSR